MSPQKLTSYVTVDKDGTEKAFDSYPERSKTEWISDSNFVTLKAGTIEQVLGHKLTWKNEPHVSFSVNLPAIELTTTPRTFIHES